MPFIQNIMYLNETLEISKYAYCLYFFLYVNLHTFLLSYSHYHTHIHFTFPSILPLILWTQELQHYCRAGVPNLYIIWTFCMGNWRLRILWINPTKTEKDFNFQNVIVFNNPYQFIFIKGGPTHCLCWKKYW